MQRGRRCVTGALVAAMAGLAMAPRAARAQTWIHSWTLCTPGSFSSCHSVSIETEAVLNSSNVRTGTLISISEHNFQGQGYALDNTTSSGLYDVNFVAPGESFTSGGGAPTTGAPSGGATGTPTWTREWGTYNQGTIGNVPITGAHVEAYAGSSTGFPLIGGCGTNSLGTLYVYGGHTCTPGSTITFSFSLDQIIDANQFTAVGIEALGVGAPGGECYSDPNVYGSGPLSVPACDLQSNTTTETTAVTPEPATIVLLTTGLFGIGGVGLRRRKRVLSGG